MPGLLIAAALFSAGLLACGPRTIGYGVVVWSAHEDSYATGSIVPIIEESTIQDSYTLLGGDGEGFDVPRWRVSFFKREKEARAYLEAFEPWKLSIARADSDGLPVRREPDGMSERVYRMRRGETVKILSRENTPGTEGQYEDYWYEVLTEGGIAGWVFGYNLTISRIGSEDTAEAGTGRDPLLVTFLENTWRPEYYQEMIAEGTVDLELFQELYGVFPFPEEKRIVLTTRFASVEFNYTEIIPAGGRDYIFAGTPLKITIQSEQRIVAEYPTGQRFMREAFIKLDADVASIIAEERERRLDRYEKLTERGTVLHSDAYGTLELAGFTKFSWREYWRLVPNIISQESGNTGKLDFSIFLVNSLQDRYDGALQLTFQRQRDKPLTFLYELTVEGVRFIYVPPEGIDKSVIREAPEFPIVISFVPREG